MPVLEPALQAEIALERRVAEALHAACGQDCGVITQHLATPPRALHKDGRTALSNCWQ